jgi:DNA segregation ATPase FtsK/SpoIIIE, S-DNA-T family
VNQKRTRGLDSIGIGKSPHASSATPALNAPISRPGLSLAAARHAHRAAYHGVRSPAYFARALGFAVWGVLAVGGRLIAWWHIPGTTRLEWDAAANGLLHDHLRLHKQGRETRKARGTILAVCLAALAAAVAAMAVFAPWWGWALAAVVLFTLFALAGRPAGKTITTRAELPAQVQPPDQDVITRALGSLGIAEINRAIASGSGIGFPSPVREDGPGWRAEVDLPYGVTTGMVIDRREQLASGLRRPLGAVWPEPVSHEHAGRLELWVGRADVSKARPPAWPLLKSGQADVFGDLPFGTDVRGRTVKISLIYNNVLIGSIPPPGQDRRRAGAELRHGPGPAGGEVDARAQGLRRPGPDGVHLAPLRVRHR